MDDTRREKSGAAMLGAARRAPVALDDEGLVEVSPPGLPLAVRARLPGLRLTEWARRRRDWLREQLLQVSPPETPRIRRCDLGARASDTSAHLLSLVEARLGRAALGEGPLLEVLWSRLGPDRHILSIRLPALCADVQSLKLLATEVAARYTGHDAVDGASPETLQYADFAQWQNDLLESEEAASERSFWRRQGAAYRRGQLPLGQPETREPAFRPRFLPVALPADLAAGLLETARGLGLTVPDLLLAGWRILQARLTGLADPVVGVGCDGRPYDELRQVPGLFARRLPVAGRLDGRQSFAGAAAHGSRFWSSGPWPTVSTSPCSAPAGRARRSSLWAMIRAPSPRPTRSASAVSSGR